MPLQALERPVMEYHNAALEDRCAPRVKLDVPATLRPSGVTGFKVNVTNLSLGGFACEAITGMPPGTRCWLTLPGLSPLQAEVAWNNGRMVGCAFADLLNQAILDSILHRFGVVIPQS